MKWRLRILLNTAQKVNVELLYEIITLLIDRIDGSFYGGDGWIAGTGIAGLIFAMPQVEVGAVLPQEETLESALRGNHGGGIAVRAMPVLGCEVLQVREMDNVQGHAARAVA